MLQFQYAFIYQSLSDYLRLRSCCCWKRGRLNEEDYLIIGPPIDSTTCWSDVILNRSIHPENLELPSVHHVNRPKILISRGLPSCPQRLETPVPFVVPAQDNYLDRRSVKKTKGRRFKNKVRPVTESGECCADFPGKSLVKGTDNRDQSYEVLCKSHLMLEAEAQMTAVGVCEADTPDAAPVEMTSTLDTRAEEGVDSKMRILSSSDSCSGKVVRSNERRNKESDNRSCPGQQSEHVIILYPIYNIYSLISHNKSIKLLYHYNLFIDRLIRIISFWIVAAILNPRRTITDTEIGLLSGGFLLSHTVPYSGPLIAIK